MFFDRFRLFASAFTNTCAKYMPTEICSRYACQDGKDFKLA